MTTGVCHKETNEHYFKMAAPYVNRGSFFLLKIFLLIIFLSGIDAFIDGLYCGKQNCYDVLGVTRETPKADIGKAYRKLAKQYHPDRHKDPEQKAINEELFKTVAVAYETLKDDDSRKEYDYMLDNPDEVYAHYYYYYKRRMAPKVDVRIVVAVTITVISIVQYYSSWTNYNTAIQYLATVPKYRFKAQHIAKEEGLLDDVNSKKKRRQQSKEEIKEAEEQVIRNIIASRMEIKGGYSPPSLQNVLWVQIVTFPYYAVLYVIWWVAWVWKFNIKREPYGKEEKLYLIRKYLELGENQFAAKEEAEKEDLLAQELWMKDKFKVWKEERDEEQKRKLAESGRYRSFRRYMKKGGPGQMTFAED